MSTFPGKIAEEVSWLGFVIRRRLKSGFSALKRHLVSPGLPVNPEGRVYIHLGCGDINSPEFINVDVRAGSHIHYCRDIRDLSIFPDNSADLVYACHVLEHIPRSDLKKTLWEWRRILKKGGVLRLSVPDFDKAIGLYEASSRDIGRVHSILMGDQQNDNDIHYSLFNYQYLCDCLLGAGFREVRPWEPDKVDHHAFKDWADKKHLSLNLEAIK